MCESRLCLSGICSSGVIRRLSSFQGSSLHYASEWEFHSLMLMRYILWIPLSPFLVRLGSSSRRNKRKTGRSSSNMAAASSDGKDPLSGKGVEEDLEAILKDRECLS